MHGSFSREKGGRGSLRLRLDRPVPPGKGNASSLRLELVPIPDQAIPGETQGRARRPADTPGNPDRVRSSRHPSCAGCTRTRSWSAPFRTAPGACVRIVLWRHRAAARAEHDVSRIVAARTAISYRGARSSAVLARAHVLRVARVPHDAHSLAPFAVHDSARSCRICSQASCSSASPMACSAFVSTRIRCFPGSPMSLRFRLRSSARAP